MKENIVGQRLRTLREKTKLSQAKDIIRMLVTSKNLTVKHLPFFLKSTVLNAQK